MVRERALYDFNSFKFVKACFMAQDMFTVVNVQWMLEKNVYSATVGWIVLHMSTEIFWLIVLLNPCLFSV